MRLTHSYETMNQRYRPTVILIETFIQLSINIRVGEQEKRILLTNIFMANRFKKYRHTLCKYFEYTRNANYQF